MKYTQVSERTGVIFELNKRYLVRHNLVSLMRNILCLFFTGEKIRYWRSKTVSCCFHTLRCLGEKKESDEISFPNFVSSGYHHAARLKLLSTLYLSTDNLHLLIILGGCHLLTTYIDIWGILTSVTYHDNTDLLELKWP